MRHQLLLYALMFSFIGCATRTRYRPLGKNGGYSEQKIDDNLIVARFAGNARTGSVDAMRYSQFRANEVCSEQGFNITKILYTQDRTSSKTVQRASYSGNVAGLSGGMQFANASSWNETFRFPTFDTYFTCVNETFWTGIKVKNVSAEDMKQFVKDLIGAVQIVDVQISSPNRGILQVGDLILKVDGSRIQDTLQYGVAIDAAKDKQNISLATIREGTPLTIAVRATDAAPYLKKQSESLMDSVCGVSELESRPICLGVSRAPSSN